jgi:hypothetical protein
MSEEHTEDDDEMQLPQHKKAKIAECINRQQRPISHIFILFWCFHFAVKKFDHLMSSSHRLTSGFSQVPQQQESL